MRQNINSGYHFEEEFGYSRAVRVGNQVFVSGTTARGEALQGNIVVQARHAVGIIEAALKQAGASLADVVRVTTYVTDLGQADAFAPVFVEIFGDTRPVSTLVEVSRLTPDEAMIELEVTAVIDG